MKIKAPNSSIWIFHAIEVTAWKWIIEFQLNEPFYTQVFLTVLYHEKKKESVQVLTFVFLVNFQSIFITINFGQWRYSIPLSIYFTYHIYKKRPQNKNFLDWTVVKVIMLSFCELSALFSDLCSHNTNCYQRKRCNLIFQSERELEQII